MTQVSLQSPPGMGALKVVPARNRLVSAARKRFQQFRTLLQGDPWTLSDADFVHDIRVASRRLEEAARLLSPSIDRTSAKMIVKNLKAVRRAMGDLRDSDVMSEHLLKWRMPAPLKVVARTIVAELAKDRPRLMRAAAKRIASSGTKHAMGTLGHLLESETLWGNGEGKLQMTLDERIAKQTRKVRESFETAEKRQTASKLHAARIACKKLRYALELGLKVDASHALRRELQTLKQVQSILGEHHDLHVMMQRLRRQMAATGSKNGDAMARVWRSWRQREITIQEARAAEFLAMAKKWQ